MPRLPSLSSFCHHDSVFRAHRWKRLSKNGQSHSCSIHLYAHTLSSVHLNDHPTFTEFLDWRHLSLGLYLHFTDAVPFFHLLSQPFELFMTIESSPSLLEIIRPSSWSSTWPDNWNSTLTAKHIPFLKAFVTSEKFCGYPSFFLCNYSHSLNIAPFDLIKQQVHFPANFPTYSKRGIFLLQGNKVSPAGKNLDFKFCSSPLLWENEVRFAW